MKQIENIPDRGILLFKSCLVSVEYPGIESSTTYAFDKLGVDYLVSDEQSCCTGLGYYFDLFDQMSTTAVAARNFAVARKNGYTNITTMCSTCYAINKETCALLNSNEEVRSKVNTVFENAELDDLTYKQNSLDEVDNFYHVVEILLSKTQNIGKLNTIDFSDVHVATHHACHYYKVQYDDMIGNPNHPLLIDTIAKSCGADVVEWYEDKTLTCGAGFSQRHINRKTSLEVTHAKLESLKNAGVELVIHMCPNCQIQYDRYQPVIEKEFETKYDFVHMNIAQFVALALGADPGKVCGFQIHSVPLDKFLNRIGISV
ncbi:MAG: CoB--CoM heterodisulfide reductase iron-sulfur subunit B family protein [Methanosarcinaceae archaeon]|nr:CoB--CoM heterodisulfide reductase iron-sulfur subunit B family protein [Methanosarcinaceae archaeon]